MTGLNTFPAVILRLYNACRRAGVWARMVLEMENGKETLTFSTVTRPSNLPEEKGDYRRRKKPSKVKKDRERKEALLERKRTVVEREVADKPAVHCS